MLKLLADEPMVSEGRDGLERDSTLEVEKG